ncbi:MAG: hypothetical protein NVV57_11960 [Demequina sp.]|nr:hypothetical protein [Demequina sp.]
MDRIAPEERLLNLFIALSSTRARLTKQDIRSTVYGYDARMQGEDAKADTAFERMFERDKEDLRRLGVPLQTVVDAAHGADIGYRIDPSAATMEPIDLTAAELAVLSLAVDYWRDAALGTDAKQAVTKVASRVQHEPVPELPLRRARHGDSGGARHARRGASRSQGGPLRVRVVHLRTRGSHRGAVAHRHGLRHRVPGGPRPHGRRSAHLSPEPHHWRCQGRGRGRRVRDSETGPVGPSRRTGSRRDRRHCDPGAAT